MADKRYVASFSGGKDSTAMVLRILEEGLPLDEIVFFDTGWEFPQMLEHIDEFERRTGFPVTRLHPPESFEHRMIRRPIAGRTGANKGKVYRHGNGWPSPCRRWCTRLKCSTIDKHIRGAVRYIGFAADEAKRTGSLNADKMGCNVEYPLIGWDMSEDDCLQYCYDRGYRFGGLYDHFSRVSCFCCPLSRLGELRTLRKQYPDLWAQMLEWDAEMTPNRGFHGYSTVRDLDTRFGQEERQTTFDFHCDGC